MNLREGCLINPLKIIYRKCCKEIKQSVKQPIFLFEVIHETCAQGTCRNTYDIIRINDMLNKGFNSAIYNNLNIK